jgi:hypothetical protein
MVIARQQVEQRLDRRLPQRMDLHAQHHQQRAQRGLVHHRQHRAQRDDEEHRPADLLLRSSLPMLLEDHRRELDPHHDDVKRDAHRHLEHHRVQVDRPGIEHVPDVPPAAEVEDDAGGGQGIAEQAGQQRRSHQRVVFTPC